MNNPLLRKLANFTALSADECQAVVESCGDVREVAAREDVIAQGDRAGGVKLLLEGFACRYKTLEDGRRQIVAYFVPGDLCDLRVFILKRMDHSIGAIAPSRIATIAPRNMLNLLHTYPTLTTAHECSARYLRRFGHDLASALDTCSAPHRRRCRSSTHRARRP